MNPTYRPRRLWSIRSRASDADQSLGNSRRRHVSQTPVPNINSPPKQVAASQFLRDQRFTEAVSRVRTEIQQLEIKVGYDHEDVAIRYAKLAEIYEC